MERGDRSHILLIEDANEVSKRVRGLFQDVLAYRSKYEKSDRDKRTILEELRDSDKLPSGKKTLNRLADECPILLIAGSDAPGKAWALLLYHLITKSQCMQRLRTEIDPLMEESERRPTQARLEALPYLTAVIHEGLRLHGGIVRRSARLAPEPLQYEQWIISRRTPVSCISAFIHYDAEIFPEPREFKPERWLEKTPEGELRFQQKLKRHFVAFRHGMRSCFGYNLGYAVMYQTIAKVVTRFDLLPFETDRRDVDLEREWTIPQPRIDSKGVRAIVKPRAY